MRLYFFLFKSLIGIILAATFTIPSFAGDFAERRIIGFSEDGKRFAFEQYGRQDGSGFPYSEIFIIDTHSDTWTSGSPFKARLEDETQPVPTARHAALIKAGEALNDIIRPGKIIATNRATELTGDTKRMVALPRVVVPPIDQPLEFRIEAIALPGEELCNQFGQSNGFRLVQIDASDGGQTKILHEDKSIPKSRNCPLDYDLADIVTYYPNNGEPVAAVLILMKTVGFEGPDGRYLAVTTKLD